MLGHAYIFLETFSFFFERKSIRPWDNALLLLQP